jgi:Family of unknown function (DUF5522)
MKTAKKKPRVNGRTHRGLAPEDYYIDALGCVVMTAAYHLKRGYCCKQKCKHCPWPQPQTKAAKRQTDKAKPPIG